MGVVSSTGSVCRVRSPLIMPPHITEMSAAATPQSAIHSPLPMAADRSNVSRASAAKISNSTVGSSIATKTRTR